MKTGPVSARRFVGGLLLLGALLMLLLGLTTFSPALKGIAFIIYWLICYLLTGGAALMAIIDFACIRRDMKKQQTELMESTLAAARADREKNSTLEK